MGGAPGYGRVEPEPDEPVFHREWEGRVFGLVVTVKDGLSRPRLESLDPDEYLSGYYQRWLLAFERGLMARGALSAEELDAKTEHFRRNPAACPTRTDIDPELTERVRAGMYRQRDVRKSPAQPHRPSTRAITSEPAQSGTVGTLAHPDMCRASAASSTPSMPPTTFPTTSRRAR